MGSRALSQGLIEIGERVRNRRQALCWSQEKLAEMADISPNTVSRVEGGQSDMSIEVFKRLAQTLGMSASELLGDVECLQKDGQVQRMLYRMQNLKRGDQEVVLRTMDSLIDAIHCREE